LVRKTIVLVTHDLDEAVRLADRVCVLSEGGHLEQYATPGELLSHPATEFVREFIGADRGIKRLSVTEIDPKTIAPLDSVDRVDGAPSVPATATLFTALAALIDGGRGYVTVTGDGDQPLGVLTATAIAEAAAVGTD
jgi:osmoprotectant transport system ATP-binding protein